MCGDLVLKRGKIKFMDGLMIPSQEVMEQIEDTSHIYFWIWEIIKFMGNGSVLSQAATNPQAENNETK